MALLATAVPSNGQDEVVDLSAWLQQGTSAYGDWRLAPDGQSVTQHINGDPTYFVDPENTRGTLTRGTISVQTSDDDDFIGFVFGFQSPLAEFGHEPTSVNTYILDWKKGDQSHRGHRAHAGFTLYHIQGNVTGSFSHYVNGQVIGDCLWSKDESKCPIIDVLGRNLGSNLGWMAFTDYEIKLLHTTTNIRITITGDHAPFTDGLVVFDVTGQFQDGRVGFYNCLPQSPRLRRSRGTSAQGPTVLPLRWTAREAITPMVIRSSCTGTRRA